MPSNCLQALGSVSPFCRGGTFLGFWGGFIFTHCLLQSPFLGTIRKNFVSVGSM